MSTLSVIYKIGADITALQQGVDRAAAATESMANTASMAKNAIQAMAGAAVVGKVTELVREIYNNADALEKMSDQTTIGVEALQKLRGVGDETGNTLEELTSAVTMMQKRIGSGEDSAVKALERLGIGLEEFKSLDAYSEFVRVSNAVKGIHDPLERAQILSGLFGRQWSTVTPTIRADIESIGSKISVVSEDIIKRQDEIGDAFSRLKRNGMADMSRLFDFLFSGWKRADDAAKEYGDLVVNLAAPRGADISLPKMPVLDQGPVQSIEDLAKAHLRLETAAVRSFNSLQKFLQLVATGDGPQGVRALASDFEDLVATTIDVESAVNDLGATWMVFHHGLAISGQELETVTIPAFSELPNVVPQATKAIQDARDAMDGPSGFVSAAKSMLSSLNGVFARAFEGGGGLGGAIKSFAINIGQHLLSMIPVVGPFISEFAGAIVAGVSRLFGGPSQDELRGRQMVSQFEDQLHSLLTAEQMVASGGESWKQTVIAVRDAYIAAGLTEQQALNDVARLWDASRSGPEAVAAAIKTIQDRMNGLTQATSQAGDALAGLGGRISIPDLPRELVDMPAMAAGGIVTRPTFAMIGEAGPEAVVPLSRFGGGGTVVNLNFNGTVNGGAGAARELADLVEQELSYRSGLKRGRRAA